MKATTFAALRRGIEAGLVASVPQVLGTHLHGKILGFSPGSANLGPRLIERLGKLTSRRPSEETRWLGSASFHFVYSAGWGALYALAYQHRPVHPVVGGLRLSATIYALTFPGWGFATWTRTERPPRRRSWRSELLLIAPPSSSVWARRSSTAAVRAEAKCSWPRRSCVIRSGAVKQRPSTPGGPAPSPQAGTRRPGPARPTIPVAWAGTARFQTTMSPTPPRRPRAAANPTES